MGFNDLLNFHLNTNNSESIAGKFFELKLYLIFKRARFFSFYLQNDYLENNVLLLSDKYFLVQVNTLVEYPISSLRDRVKNKVSVAKPVLPLPAPPPVAPM